MPYRNAVEGAIDYAVLQAGAAPSSRIGAAGWIQGVGYDWLQGRINSGSGLGSRGWILNKLIQAGFGGTFIAPFNDKGSGEVDLVPLVGTGSATFTRATAATTVNSAGLIVNLGLNICLYSEALDDASWTKDDVTVTANAVAAPDGATTADKIIPSAVNTTAHRVRRTTAATAAIHSYSVFGKAAEYSWLKIRVGSFYANFDLTNGVVGNVSASATSSIKAYPNGWYRCTLVTAALVGSDVAYIYPATTDNAGLDTVSYSGDGVGGLYVWGAQLELGSSATPYAATTASANSAARSYYDPTTLQYLGYLSEGARTNLCLQSADFGTTWTTSNVTVSTNQVTSPDGGTNADAILEAATTSTHFINQNITIAASTTYACSVFVRGLNRTWCAIEMIGVDGAGRSAFFNLSGSGSVGTTSGTTSTEIKAYPNGWYRCTIVAASGTGAGTGALRVYSATADNTASFLGNTSNGVYAWGAQLEAGSFASSYIPTTTASVTRNADVLTFPSSGNVLGTVGSAYSEVSTLWTSGSSQRILDIGTNSPPLFMNTLNIAIFDGTTIVNGPAFTGSTSIQKIASSWGGSAMRVAKSGSVGGDGAFDGDMNIGANIFIGSNGSSTGQWFGTIRNVRIWQTQLSASQLQVLTS